MTRMTLRDDQWERIKDLLPGKSSDCGVTASDNRLFLEAVLWIARTGSPWRDLPGYFGHWHRVYVRYNRWSHKGHWTRIFAAIARGTRSRILNGGWQYCTCSPTWRGKKNSRMRRRWVSPEVV